MQTDIDKPVMLTALPYKDCQKALAIINWLANCHTRKEFNQILKTAINPLIGCNGAFYIRFLGNKKTPQLLDGIHQSVLFQNDWTEFLEAFIAAQKLPNPIKEETMNVLNFINYSCGDSACQYDSSSNASHQKTNYYTSVALFDTPEQTAAIYFYRMNPLMQDFSPRVIELLKLLRHALLGTIKTIIFLEECRNKIPNYLYKYAEPMAIVCNNGNLKYENTAFTESIKQEVLPFLSTTFSKENNIGIGRLESYCFLVQLGRRMYECTLILVNECISKGSSLYLLRLSRINNNKDRQAFIQLNRIGLTSRELEIAMFIYQGVSTRSEMLIWIG